MRRLLIHNAHIKDAYLDTLNHPHRHTYNSSAFQIHINKYLSVRDIHIKFCTPTLTHPLNTTPDKHTLSHLSTLKLSSTPTHIQTPTYILTYTKGLKGSLSPCLYQKYILLLILTCVYSHTHTHTHTHIHTHTHTHTHAAAALS